MNKNTPSALVTGGTQRIGAAIVRALHKNGYDIWLHFHQSKAQAEQLAAECNAKRANSVRCLCANLCDAQQTQVMAQDIHAHGKQLSVLVNNASSFYPTPWGKIDAKDWENLVHSNVRGPFYLAQALAPLLKQSHGSVINISDHLPFYNLQHYPIYSIAKGALNTATKSLALCLAPEVRVNALALGVIMPKKEELVMTEKTKMEIPLALKRGSGDNIADIVCFLASNDARYITGQLIPVDGGRRLFAGSI